MASVADEQSRQLNTINNIQKIIKVSPEWFEIENRPPTNLVIMVGGADFFRKNRGLRQDPYELIALVKYLKGIGAHTDEENITHVLAFDSAYTLETTKNDMWYLNQSIYVDTGRKAVPKHGNAPPYNEYDYDPTEYLGEYFLEKKEFDRHYVFIMGNIVFHFIPFNLPTQYKQFEQAQAYYPFLNGESPVTRLADQCTPQEGSLMKALQMLCIDVNATNYYLYNCAWIRGNTFIQSSPDKVRGYSGKTNRHYELMCELLNIMLSLGKPAYLLTAQDMSVFTHTNKKVGTYKQLNKTPLNTTTLFKKEEWPERQINLSVKLGGTGRIQRSTRRRKSTKTHKSRKQH